MSMPVSDPVADTSGAGISVDELMAKVGQTFTSKWITIDQSRIDTFADVTDDHQFLHVDPERAAQTPFGGTIAHGFLTLSMLSTLAYDAHPRLAGVVMAVNYGFDRIRFLAPVPSGKRIRAHFTLAKAEQRKPGEITSQWDVEMEVEDMPKPALAAHWITRRYLEGAA